MSKWKGVSRTAHFTAAVWHELGVPGAEHFVTRQGRILNGIVKWGGGFLGLHGPYSVTNLFLAPRHLGLDALLDRTKATQVIELAAGLASRGLRWTKTHSGTYLEVDQSAVIAAKQQLLASLLPTLLPGVTYKLIPADLLVPNPESGVDSLKSQLRILTQSSALSPGCLSSPDGVQSSLVISEGMTGYLGEAALRGLLRVIHGLAEEFENCTIFIDFYLKLDFRRHGRVYLAMAPARLLWRILRAPMQMFLRDAEDIQALLTSEGFRLERLYSSRELAELAGIDPPPIELFYLAELRLSSA